GCGPAVSCRRRGPSPAPRAPRYPSWRPAFGRPDLRDGAHRGRQDFAHPVVSRRAGSPRSRGAAGVGGAPTFVRERLPLVVRSRSLAHPTVALGRTDWDVAVQEGELVGDYPFELLADVDVEVPDWVAEYLAAGCLRRVAE